MRSCVHPQSCRTELRILSLVELRAARPAALRMVCIRTELRILSLVELRAARPAALRMVCIRTAAWE
jgi:hypothetical protein